MADDGPPNGARVAASVIVPFHRGRAPLERVVSAVAGSVTGLEIIVVANGHDEDLSTLTNIAGLQVHSLSRRSGPAVARNRGAEAATGSILVFVDADVVPHPTAIPAMLEVLAREPHLAGVFGAYDRHPDEQGFFSQYRNLAHAFEHERGNPEARTFWAGLGAVRAVAFESVGGFDERYPRPSIEDIDLGYRLSAEGHRLRLDAAIRGTHLKRWTVLSSIVTDIRDRGVPWSQALFKYGAMANDLNVSWTGRASVVLVYVFAISTAVGILRPAALLLALASLVGFVIVNRELVSWFARVRGSRFTLGVLGGQILHHLCNGVSMVLGSALWFGQRVLGFRTAWTLPADRWSSTSCRRRQSPASYPDTVRRS